MTVPLLLNSCPVVVLASQVVLLDEAGPLKMLMPFMRCLNDYLIHRTDRPPREWKVYRRSRMDAAQLAGINEGESNTANTIIDHFLHLNLNWSPVFSRCRLKTAGNGPKRPEI